MSSDSEKRSDSAQALAAIPGVDEAVVAALKRQWIHTAAQVLALAASTPGRQQLQRLLEYDELQFETLLNNLRHAVGPKAAERFLTPQPGGSLGLALTDEQKRRSGVK